MRLDVDVGRLLDSLGIAGRKRHCEWYALCPNPEHDDRRPTTWRMVDDRGSERHGLMSCWSCSYSGDCITLVRDRLGVGYHAALSWIQQYLYPEEVEDGQRPAIEIVQQKVFRMPAGVVEGKPLAAWPTLFRRYLEGRNVQVWQVERWGLGYAVEGKLAGRVVLPTRDQAGRLLTYAARAIGRDPLRYLTPSRDDGADPSAVFGEQCWGPGGTVVVCEGAMDALAVERAVDDVAIAVPGSGGGAMRNNANAFRKLERFTHVIVATDSDDAGDDLAREVEDALGGRCRRATLPAGLDCAGMEPDGLFEALSQASKRK